MMESIESYYTELARLHWTPKTFKLPRQPVLYYSKLVDFSGKYIKPHEAFNVHPPPFYPCSAHLVMFEKFKRSNRGSNHEGQHRDEGVHYNFPPLHRDILFHP
jgi:hypothetical protein